MKHLKLFEAFRTEDYYVELNEDDPIIIADYEVVSKMEDISNEMVNKIMNQIKTYLPTNYKLFSGEYTWDNWLLLAEHNPYDLTIEIYDKSKRSLRRMSNNKFEKTQKWVIENLGDEYFLVTMTEWDHFGSESNYYFKCDQWEGLEMFIENHFKPELESIS